MSIAAERRREYETLAWITDDEAEFWTNKSPTNKYETFDHYPTAKEPTSDSDGLYFKSNNHLNPEMEDHLSLLYKEGIEKQAKDVAEKAEKIQISEIFEFDENNQLNENIPGVSMSFLDRLFHQLTRPPSSELDDISDEEFTEIDEKEITTVINNNIDQSLNNQDKLKKQNSLTKTIQSFIDEITEETNVIRGTLDEETLFNRRSRKAKYSPSMIENKQTLINRTSL